MYERFTTMKNVMVLDCTLRDGGRIIDCKFDDEEIIGLSTNLQKSNIDIIEVGFIRDHRKVDYQGNSTFFTDVDQIRPYVNKNGKTIYTAFIDYGMCDIDTLKPFDGTSIDAIRFGFTKKNYDEEYEEVIRWAKLIKEKGYKLFIQGVNSLNYTDLELLNVVQMINEIHPFSFGIVDTYGAMYMDDVDRLYGLIDHNMKSDICINFHSHNNYQLSFAFAQEVIKLSSNSQRRIIIDGTLSGMGKVAGNLNTELLVEFLVRKKGYTYDLDLVFDTIDNYIHKYTLGYHWGYSIPALMAGIYKSHPNNVIYLTEKYRLDSKDIGKLLSMIDPKTRQRYDYDNIQKLYMEYNHTKVDDSYALDRMRDLLNDRNILVIMPGSSITTHKEKIIDYINNFNPIVISVNFVTDFSDSENRLPFFGSPRRFIKNAIDEEISRMVIVSNITKDIDMSKYKEVFIVNYESLIDRENELFDNSTIMLFNLFRRLGISSFTVAGFDGYSKKTENYFDEKMFEGSRFETKFDSITGNMRKMLKKYALSLNKKEDVRFLTPSVYEDIFKDE